MQQLPRGYYAVQTDFENAPKDVFTYKGVSYAVTEGVNLFGTIADANAAATEIPEVVLEGLDYESFTTPVLLFSVGKHKWDKFTFDRSIALLGEGACVDPNLWQEDRLQPPALNPARAEERESLAYGSYWYGKVFILNDQSPDTVIVDGFSSKAISFRDYRDNTANECRVSIRNMIHVSPCGYMLYYFDEPRAGSALHREIEFSNIRSVDFDDYDYGTNFALICARKVTFSGIYYDTTGQTFGFSTLSGGLPSCEMNAPQSDYVIKHSYFRNLAGQNGVMTAARKVTENTLNLTVSDTVFIDASRVGESPLNAALPTADSALRVENCAFVETRGNTAAAIAISGVSEQITLTDTTFEGFTATTCRKPPAETVAPDYIENRATSWQTTTADPHVVVGEQAQDFHAMDALYEGTKAYYGDQHVHTDCGGTSDGSFPMKDWVAAMDDKGVDFAIIVDHRQMRGFFLPEWDEERFLMGTEPGTDMQGLNKVHYGQCSIHYNMLFPHKYGLAMLLANFPEFNFRGDELTGSFGYPKLTKERMLEIGDYLRANGGMLVHPHPKTMLSSDDVLDYYIGEHTYQEVIYGGRGTAASFKNYELWVALLAQGKHVFVASGSDTHGKVSNSALSTFYTKRRHSTDFFEQMYKGDYTAGEVGIKMCIDGNPMGSEIEYKDGMRLTLRMDDMFERAWQPDTVYELRIVTDQGVAYASRYNGKLPQKLELEVQKRAFYRAEVFDVTNSVWFAHGNPIWME